MFWNVLKSSDLFHSFSSHKDSDSSLGPTCFGRHHSSVFMSRWSRSILQWGLWDDLGKRRHPSQRQWEHWVKGLRAALLDQSGDWMPWKFSCSMQCIFSGFWQLFCQWRDAADCQCELQWPGSVCMYSQESSGSGQSHGNSYSTWWVGRVKREQLSVCECLEV